jgi:hypothetical protein
MPNGLQRVAAFFRKNPLCKEKSFDRITVTLSANDAQAGKNIMSILFIPSKNNCSLTG